MFSTVRPPTLFTHGSAPYQAAMARAQVQSNAVSGDAVQPDGPVDKAINGGNFSFLKYPIIRGYVCDNTVKAHAILRGMEVAAARSTFHDGALAAHIDDIAAGGEITVQQWTVIMNALGLIFHYGYPLKEPLETLQRCLQGKRLGKQLDRFLSLLADYVNHGGEKKFADHPHLVVELLKFVLAGKVHNLLFAVHDTGRIGETLKAMAFIPLIAGGNRVFIAEDADAPVHPAVKLLHPDYSFLCHRLLPTALAEMVVDVAINAPPDSLHVSTLGITIPSFSLELLAAAGEPQIYVGGLSWLGAGIYTLPLGRLSSHYLRAQCLTRKLQEAPLDYADYFPPTNPARAWGYLRRILPASVAPPNGPFVIFNPWCSSGLSPDISSSDSIPSVATRLTRLYWCHVLRDVLAADPQLRVLVLDGSFAAGHAADDTVAVLNRELKTDRVIDIGAPSLDVLRDLFGLECVLASIHVDTGTHHVAATVAGHTAYYLTGPKFHVASPDIGTWSPPSRDVHPLFSDGSASKELGMAIAQDLVRRSGQGGGAFLNVNNALVEDVRKLNFRALRHGDESVLEKMFVILDAVMGENPDNKLLGWHVAHALMALKKLAERKESPSPSLADILERFSHLEKVGPSYLYQVDLSPISPFNEFFFGPLMRHLLPACGLDPYSMAFEILQ